MKIALRIMTASHWMLPVSPGNLSEGDHRQEAGHMMHIHQLSLQQLKQDLAAFVRAAAH